MVGRSFVRSPALEFEKLERVERGEERNARGREARAGQRRALPGFRAGSLSPRQVSPAGREVSTRAARPVSTPLGKMRYAAVEPVESGRVARRPLKTLPRRGRVSAAVKGDMAKMQHTGVTAGWRLRKWQQPKEQTAPVQVISEEEEKKLAELETHLPRVAGKIDPWLLMIVLALLCIGIVMVYSASSFIAARYYGDASYFLQRELIWVVLGVVAMVMTMRVDYRHWRRLSLVGMVIILLLLVIVLRFGVNVYGASRWLAFRSFFSFQPSELTKLVLAMYIADWLARKGNQVGTFLYGLAPFVILVGLVLGLVLLENDMGTAIIIAGFATAMFFTAGANIVQFLLALACGGLIFLREALRGYRYFRITGFLDPFKNVTGINLQLYQSLLALGSGGLFGLGLGASRQKTGYLPLPYTDSIFAILGEELGFIGCTIVVVFFLALAFRGFRLARRAPDVYGALLATGITTWLVLQAMINVGASTGTIPYTGVPLPLISFGGSSLVVSMAAIGVLLNISRYIQKPETPLLSRRTITENIKRAKG
jgi:cell division protein FtsW